MRRDARTTAALDHERIRIRSDDRERPHVTQRQHAVAVLQQHKAFTRGAARQLPINRIVGAVLFLRRFVVEPAGALEQAEDVPHLVVEFRFVDLAVAHRINKARTEPLRRARHLEVEPGVHRGRGAVGAVPVGHHHAVEAPLVAQDRQEWRVLAAVRAIDAVVRSHDRPRARLAHRRLERNQIDLPQRALVHLGADRHPLELGVVRDEMLDRARHAL
jgi:hypothetical protein